MFLNSTLYLFCFFEINTIHLENNTQYTPLFMSFNTPILVVFFFVMITSVTKMILYEIGGWQSLFSLKRAKNIVLKSKEKELAIKTRQ